jgi:ABC-type transporter Mla subunit MlaD
MYINVKDMLVFLAAFLGACFVVAIGVLLIIALIRLNKALKRTGKLLEDNAENIDSTMKQLPTLVGHFDEIGESLKSTVSKAEVAIDSVGGILSGESITVRENSTAQSIVAIADSVLQIVLGYLARKEK